MPRRDRQRTAQTTHDVEATIVIGQVYSFEDEDGAQWHWSIPHATELAQARGELMEISLQESQITLAFVQAQNQDLNLEYALTTDLDRPLIFVPFKGKVRLIDGWHRLAHAAMAGRDILPAYFLTQAEADACLLAYLPPGKGLDWGQWTPR